MFKTKKEKNAFRAGIIAGSRQAKTVRKTNSKRKKN